MGKFGFVQLLPPSVQGCIITTYLSPTDPNWDFEAFYVDIRHRMTSIWTISHPVPSGVRVPPNTRRVVCASLCPSLSDADWSLQSYMMEYDSRGAIIRQCWRTGAASSTRGSWHRRTALGSAASATSTAYVWVLVGVGGYGCGWVDWCGTVLVWVCVGCVCVWVCV